MIFRLTRFILVGKEFFVAFQTKFLTLLGIGKLQIAFHKGLSLSAFD